MGAVKFSFKLLEELMFINILETDEYFVIENKKWLGHKTTSTGMINKVVYMEICNEDDIIRMYYKKDIPYPIVYNTALSLNKTITKELKTLLKIKKDFSKRS